MPVTRKEGVAGVVEISFEYVLRAPALSYARTARKYLTKGSGSKKSNVVTLPMSRVVVYRPEAVPYDTR